MPSKKQSAPNPRPNLQIHKATDFRSLYVNWVQGTFTPFDVSLAIGQIRSTGPTSFDVDHQANILFSPLEAKIALAMLGNLIRVYENRFGKVKIPKEMEGQFATPGPTISAEKKTEGD
jgi:hypothetical protein